jgi:hypothetical protein
MSRSAEVAEGDVITVYCEGLPDNEGNSTHARFILPFNWIALGSTSHVWSDGVRWANDTGEGGPTRRSNRVLTEDRPGEVGVDMRSSGARGQFRLRCPRCGYDNQRNTSTTKGMVPPEVAAVFDRLFAAEVYEISMRALIQYAYPAE